MSASKQLKATSEAPVYAQTQRNTAVRDQHPDTLAGTSKRRQRLAHDGDTGFEGLRQVGGDIGRHEHAAVPHVRAYDQVSLARSSTVRLDCSALSFRLTHLCGFQFPRTTYPWAGRSAAPGTRMRRGRAKSARCGAREPAAGRPTGVPTLNSLRVTLPS